ncbi:uncharacterized protein MONBRDRAFT_15088 [Monosiga brevicollis MX1]|uniref:Uncharacterized protein n=1 Tax=Monosiga brevicollis TaxID=81824 RepID=A9UTA8_MONBE|nr:uncharacterized protein MONBRDRAFT_15088 [Monosiga brevicollis MX1]EDQ91213.1 predicted protein [Monosiga brevicollis MX1]|eukprot:XP_001743635.1 hypothetical protein [Monosiga brevicollis MX1]
MTAFWLLLVAVSQAYPLLDDAYSPAEEFSNDLAERVSRESALSPDLRANPDTCVALNPHSVFYNRVPKAASTSLKTLASQRAHKNGYIHISSTVYNDRGFFETDQEEANVQRIQAIFDQYDKVLYDQHIRFLNFSKFGKHQPAYINMVREPISRAVSTYYFARVGQHSRRDEIRALLGEQADWDINTCIDRREECRWFTSKIEHFNLMTRFFCGHSEACRVVDDAAFEVAKYNLEHNFVFVGVTERFAESVRVLEKILPKFFRGAYRTISSAAPDASRQNVNKKAGAKPNQENLEILQHLARYDLALYQFASGLFERKLQACFSGLDVPAAEQSPSLGEQTSQGGSYDVNGFSVPRA